MRGIQTTYLNIIFGKKKKKKVSILPILFINEGVTVYTVHTEIILHVFHVFIYMYTSCILL